MIEKDALELTQEERLRQEHEIQASLAKQIDRAMARDDMAAARKLAEREHRVITAMVEPGRNTTWDMWFN